MIDHTLSLSEPCARRTYGACRHIPFKLGSQACHYMTAPFNYGILASRRQLPKLEGASSITSVTIPYKLNRLLASDVGLIPKVTHFRSFSPLFLLSPSDASCYLWLGCWMLMSVEVLAGGYLSFNSTISLSLFTSL